MKKLIAFLTVLAFIILCWFGWNWYKCNIICCDQTTKVNDNAKKVIVSKDPIVFNWDSWKAITNGDWPTKKQELIASMKDGRILRIVGPYYEGEVNNTNFDNLGLARADVVRQELAADIDPSKMEVGSQLLDYYDGAKEKLIPLKDMRWLVRNDNIKEIDGKALIYFPTASTKKIENINITNYLKDVAKVLEGNTKTISVTGHSDNTGNSEANVKLGLGRAESIKNTLISYGIAADRITTDSKGETMPIATNDTPEGRQKNRRVELQIN